MKDAGGTAAELLDGKTEESTSYHGGVAEGEGEHISGKELVHLDSERVTRLLDVTSCGCHNHYSKADPKQHKEASEVTVLTPRVEVRDSRRIVDVVKLLALRLGPGLLARGGNGLSRGRSIIRDRSASSTTQGE